MWYGAQQTMKIITTKANILTICKEMRNVLEQMWNASSYPLLIIPALCQGCLGHEQADGGLVSSPQVAAHLDIAQAHAQHWEEVGQEEEYDIVPVIYNFNHQIPSL